jgi:DNA topoisomerase III
MRCGRIRDLVGKCHFALSRTIGTHQHAPKKSGGEPPGQLGSKPASPAQILFAEKIAQDKGNVIPDETKVSSAAMSAWIKSNKGAVHGKGRRKTANKPSRSTAAKSAAPTKRSRQRTADADAAVAPPTPARQNSAPGRAVRHFYRGVRD